MICSPWRQSTTDFCRLKCCSSICPYEGMETADKVGTWDIVNGETDQEKREETRRDNLQPLHLLKTPSQGFPGVLRYKGESQDQQLDIHDVRAKASRVSLEYCEFCAGRARPPLHPPYAKNSEEFCCAQYEELFEMVAAERSGALDKPDEQPEGVAQIADVIKREEEEMRARTKALEESRRQQKEMEQYYQEASSSHAGVQTSDNYRPNSNTITFQLSDSAFGADTQTDSKDPELKDTSEMEPTVLSEKLGPYRFGVLHHKETMTFTERYYSNGNKCLTVFPDGSVQVLYPSGNLALLISSGTERVCIVQDDRSLDPPMRCIFQSNGRATCYHSGGTIWMNVDMWGGQCLSKEGERTRRWCWSDHAHTPTPLRPIFLSVNQNIGVRVLGRQQVFVSFLAMGLQAKFSVGTTLQLVDHATTVPPQLISSEELLLLATRFGLLRSLLCLQSCYQYPSSTRAPALRVPQYILSLGKKLKALSDDVPIGQRDRAFINKYIEDYL